MRKALSFILALLLLFAATAVYAADAAEERPPLCAFSNGKSFYKDGSSSLSDCRICLEPMESIFVRDSDGHMMFSTLKGNSVAQVIDNKDQLIDHGVNEEQVNSADEATERLIAVLTPYSLLENERDKFEYYKENYEEIRSQFMRLYQALYSLLGSSLVRMELTKREKLHRYCQFVSQLYVIATALDDAVTFSPDWRIRGNDGENVVMYRPSDLLESVQLITDRNAANPVGLTYPDAVMFGDVNNDGLINKKDSLFLKKYLADSAYPIDLAAADVNGDGNVNKKDSLRLKQYLAGFDVTLGA